MDEQRQGLRWGVYVVDRTGKVVEAVPCTSRRDAMQEYAYLRDVHRGGNEVVVYRDDEMVASSAEDDGA
jgi:hypothetical protein